jgi:hypothetical protein
MTRVFHLDDQSRVVTTPLEREEKKRKETPMVKCQKYVSKVMVIISCGVTARRDNFER